MIPKSKKRFSLKSRWQRTRSLFAEFPSQFWVMVAAAFIDRLGGAMLFPFFTLYLTQKFEISMTQVGVLFGLYSITGVVGSMVGGALTDRLGRKRMMIFGLAASALSMLLLGFVNRVEMFSLVILVVGVLAESGGPAQQALVADLLPEEKRAQGFGILRVVFNLAVVIGPLIGGLIATRSYFLLFILDAVASSITALIIFFTLKETWRPQEAGKPAESMLQTFGGYGVALRDRAFVWYLAASALMVMVYMQMNTTLAVYLRDWHGVDARGFSYILSLNAAMVVLFQFPVTRWVTRYRPLVVMAAGTVLYAVGFAMYGVVAAFPLFLLAMVIITIGEMMVSPVGQAIVARLAPEAMRGRYMAVFGFSWVIPTAVGPLLAGLVLDNLNPNFLWYAAGILGLLAAVAFYALGWLGDRARWKAVDQRVKILEHLEEGRLAAQTAAQLLEKVGESPWVRLAPDAPPSSRRHIRIRVNDLNTGGMKMDLRLPMGLVNTVLVAGGQFSANLDTFDNQSLKDLVARSAEQGGTHAHEDGDKRIEVHVE